MQCPASIARGNGFRSQQMLLAAKYFSAAYARSEVEKYYPENRATDRLHQVLSTTLIISS